MIGRNGTYVIRGCLRDADSSDDYENRCVRRLDNQAEQALRKASEKVGNELAKEWNAKRIGAGPVLARAKQRPNRQQRLCAPRREKTRIMPNSVGPAVGEHAITVQ